MRLNLLGIKKSIPVNKNIRKKNTNMSNISTAFALQIGISEAVLEDENMMIAAQIAKLSNFDSEVTDLLHKYAANLSASVATKVVQVVMPVSEFNSMMDELREVGAFDGLGE